MNEREIAKVASRVVGVIDNTMTRLADKSGHQMAEAVYNAVALTMLTRICVGLSENRGADAYKHYWHDVTETMDDIIERYGCTTVKH